MSNLPDIDELAELIKLLPSDELESLLSAIQKINNSQALPAKTCPGPQSSNPK